MQTITGYNATNLLLKMILANRAVGLSNRTRENLNTIHFKVAEALIQNRTGYEIFTGPDGGRMIRQKAV